MIPSHLILSIALMAAFATAAALAFLPAPYKLALTSLTCFLFVGAAIVEAIENLKK